MRADLEDLANNCTAPDAPYGFTLTPRTFPNETVPLPAMTSEDFARYQGMAGGTIVSNTDAGVVIVARATSEIPNTRRLVAPNFGPTVLYLGFEATRADGHTVTRDYYSPNGHFLRPALFPSVETAREALHTPDDYRGPRLWYPADTPDGFTAYLASMSPGTRDEAKEGSIGS